MSLLSKLKENDKKGLFNSNDEFVNYNTGILPLDYANGFWQEIRDPETGETKYEAITGIIGGTFVSVIGDTGTGKMEPVDTIIPTPSGFKRFGDLKVGDTVYSKYGAPTTVTGVYPKGVQDVYLVKFADGRVTRCGKDHLWTVKNMRSGFCKVSSTKSLMDQMDGGARFSIPMNDNVRFNYIDPSEFPLSPFALICVMKYLYITDDDYLEFTTDDPAEIKHIADFTEHCGFHDFEGSIVRCNNGRDMHYLFRFKKNGEYIKITDFLKPYLDKFGRASILDRDIPDIYYYIPACDAWDIVELFESNDPSDNKDGETAYYTNSPEFKDYIMFLLRARGKYVYYLTTGKNGYMIVSKDARELLIKDITKTDERVEQMCIMVDNPSHLYLTKDFVLTHNTTLGDQIGYNIIKSFEDGMLYHIDAERTTLKQRILRICGLVSDDERLVLKKENTSIEDVLEMVNAICDVKESGGDMFKYTLPSRKKLGATFQAYIPTVFLIDSLPAFNSREYNTDDLGTNMDQARAARDISRFFNNILDKMLKYNITVIVINHIRPNVTTNPYAQPPKGLMMLKPTETLVRGNVAQFLTQSYFRINMVQSNTYTMDQEGFSGFRAQIQIAKTKTNFVGSSVTVAFNKDIGFDPIYTLFEFADSIGLVGGRNPYMYFQTMEAYKFSRKDFRRKYIEEKDFRDSLMALLKPYLEALLGTKEMTDKDRIVYGDLMDIDSVEAAVVDANIDVSAITDKKKKKK